MQFRLSEDLAPGDEVEVWLPRFRLSNPDQLMPWVPINRGLPVDTRWQAQFVSVASSYLSTARPREGEFGVVLRLNATEGLPRDGFAAVAIATALEGGVDLLPPRIGCGPTGRGPTTASLASSSKTARCRRLYGGAALGPAGGFGGYLYKGKRAGLSMGARAGQPTLCWMRRPRGTSVELA